MIRSLPPPANPEGRRLELRELLLAQLRCVLAVADLRLRPAAGSEVQGVERVLVRLRRH